MPDITQLPALLRLYDDPSPTVRATVLAELSRWEDELEQALLGLDDPPAQDTVSAVMEAVAGRLAATVRRPRDRRSGRAAPGAASGDASGATSDDGSPADAADRDQAGDDASASPGSGAGLPRFAVGQLVRHRRYGYRGVVVARDPRCAAPDEWYQGNRTQPDREQAWYHVLVHDSDQVTYAAQTSLGADDRDDDVEHPWVERFFDGREGRRYLRNDRPWPPGAQ